MSQKWYIIHTYSGFEQKVRTAILDRAKAHKVEDLISEVLVPTEKVEEMVKEALKPFNLTHAQLNALYILYENDPGPVSANELKERILVANPDVTRLLDRLVVKGYVHRETCPINRRKIDISLTEPGKEIIS